MKEKRITISTDLLLAAFRSLTPENQRAMTALLKALGSSSKRKSDSDDSKKQSPQ